MCPKPRFGKSRKRRRQLARSAFSFLRKASAAASRPDVERVGDVGDSALVEPDGDELVSQLGKRRWRVMGDPEDGWWVEVDSDGNELPGDWEYDRKGGYVYCAFA